MRSRTTRRDFLRMMGAAAGVAVGATLPGIPPNASASDEPVPGHARKAAVGEDRVPGRDRRVRRDDHPRSGGDPVRRRAGRRLRRHGGLLHGGRERTDRREGAGRPPGEGGPGDQGPHRPGGPDDPVGGEQPALLEGRRHRPSPAPRDQHRRGGYRRAGARGASEADRPGEGPRGGGHDPQRAGSRTSRRGEGWVLQDGPRGVQLPFRRGRRGDGEGRSRVERRALEHDPGGRKFRDRRHRDENPGRGVRVAPGGIQSRTRRRSPGSSPTPAWSRRSRA